MTRRFSNLRPQCVALFSLAYLRPSPCHEYHAYIQKIHTQGASSKGGEKGVDSVPRRIRPLFGDGQPRMTSISCSLPLTYLLTYLVSSISVRRRLTSKIHLNKS